MPMNSLINLYVKLADKQHAELQDYFNENDELHAECTEESTESARLPTLASLRAQASPIRLIPLTSSTERGENLS